MRLPESGDQVWAPGDATLPIERAPRPPQAPRTATSTPVDKERGRRITPSQAAQGVQGYYVNCISLYTEDYRRMEKLKRLTGCGNASEIHRRALRALEDSLTKGADTDVDQAEAR